MYIKLHYILFILFLFLLGAKSCLATNGFYDDFSNKNENIWNYYNNNGKIDYINGSMFLDSDYYTFPLVINKNKFILKQDEDYEIKLRFKYESGGYMGDGIGIGFTGKDGRLFYQFGIWRDNVNGSLFYYNDFRNNGDSQCVDFSRVNDLDGRKYFNLNLGLGEWHLLQIKKTDTSYAVYVDPDVNNNPIYITPNNQCLPEFIWFGNTGSGGGTDWNNIFVDDLNIKSTNDRNKIVILPGLGASWNTEALVANQEVPIDQWKMTPFVKNYDSLINLLKNNNLVEDRDFFVWNYDWRKPINEIVSDFNNFVTTEIGSSDVDLIGHSLGGVVARAWKQNQIENNRNINVYMLGSPNNGSLEAYDAWSGGLVSNSPDIKSIAINILLQLNRKNGVSNLDSFRSFAPVLKDLLPTYDFVKKQNKIIPVNVLESKNDYLIQKNNDAKNLDLNLTSYLGTGQKTEEFINITENTIFEKILKIWPDGKPVGYFYGEGDGTVLKKYANSNLDTSVIELNSNHGNLVNNSLNDLVSKLNLSGSTNSFSDDFSNSLVFFIGSPVSYTVKCDDNAGVEDNDGLVIIKNNNYKNCLMNITGTGNGIYHLVYGQTNKSSDDWNYQENKIQTNENISISFDPNNGKINKDASNINFIRKLIKDDISKLMESYPRNSYLTNSLKLLEANNLDNLINNIFLFRKTTKENVITLKVVNNVENLYEIVNKSNNGTTAQKNYLKTVQSKALIDKMTQLNYAKNILPGEFSAVSYQKSTQLIKSLDDDIKSKNYTAVIAKSLLAGKFLGEVW